MRGVAVALSLLLAVVALFFALWFVLFVFVGPAVAHERPAAFVVPQAARQWQRTIIGDARYYFGLDVDYSVFFAQIAQESGWRADARSRVGALGLAQFMPATARGYQKNVTRLQQLCADAGGCPLDPRWAIRAMVAMDRDLWRQYPFAAGVDHRWGLALAAYNGGGVAIRRERELAAARGLDATLWFDGIELVCVRAAWACKENREYPRVILFRWRPGYRAWLARA